ncbi:MAG: FG-GAP-like repeat-containing protein, partial [Candidatus Glassbacteria bacterium]
EAANWLGGLDELLGTVTDAETGDTLVGARVELPEIGEFDSTDTEGLYSFRMILPGTLLVVTSKFGYQIDSSTVMIEQDTTTVHDVALNSVTMGTIAGNVRDIDTGDGISAVVDVFWTGINVATTNTNPSTGYYSVDLPAGFYDVTVTPESPYIGETVTGVEVVELDTTVLDFDFQPVTVYTDVSSSSGIEMGGYGQGCAWGDFDGDGDDDVYVTNILGDNRLLQNDSGTFTDVAAAMGVDGAGDSFAACWGDFDRDNDLDLFVAVRNDANKLYRNDGTGFTEIAASVGLTEVAYSQGAAWLDYNLDGWIDLFVVNRSLINRLYRNDAGTFTDVTEEMGLTDSGTGSGLGISDFNGDGYPDIYVLHKGSPNTLFRNDITVFTDVTDTYGVGGGNANSNGCAWGDFDGDGDFDLYVTNSASANLLFRNDGSSFTDVSATSGTDNPDPSYQAIWVDYDSDADFDLFVSNSTISTLYLNTGGGNFVDVASIAGVNVTLATGAAASDFDLDGRMDLYIVRSNNQDDKLMQNDGNLNTWINIALRGRNSDRNGIGAKVLVTADGFSLLQEVHGGGGYYSQDSFTLHFGLVRETVVDQIVVQWPSGKVKTLNNLSSNQKIIVVETSIHKVPIQF